MEVRDAIVEIVQRMGLVDSAGRIKVLDSIALIDLIVELESATGTQIPTNAILSKEFQSIDGIEAIMKRAKGLL